MNEEFQSEECNASRYDSKSSTHSNQRMESSKDEGAVTGRQTPETQHLLTRALQKALPHPGRAAARPARRWGRTHARPETMLVSLAPPLGIFSI